MKILVVCNDRIEAEIIKSKLEANGIIALISADDVAGYEIPLSLLSGVKVLVHEEDFAVAQEVLNLTGLNLDPLR